MWLAIPDLLHRVRREERMNARAEDPGPPEGIVGAAAGRPGGRKTGRQVNGIFYASG